MAKFEAGGVFGEMALIERGTCTATVSASDSSKAGSSSATISARWSPSASPAALRVQHALTLALSDKLRALNAKVLEVAAAEDKPQIGVRRRIRSAGQGEAH